MRATPPAARMSAGTRSKAITATDPASSAIAACSAFVTSITTPPFCILAKPRFSSSVPNLIRVRSRSRGMVFLRCELRVRGYFYVTTASVRAERFTRPHRASGHRRRRMLEAPAIVRSHVVGLRTVCERDREHLNYEAKDARRDAEEKCTKVIVDGGARSEIGSGTRLGSGGQRPPRPPDLCWSISRGSSQARHASEKQNARRSQELARCGCPTKFLLCVVRFVNDSPNSRCAAPEGRDRGGGKRLSEPSVSSHPVRVVCVTGMPGCGKEEILVVARDLGFTIVRMGDVGREEAQRRELPITDSAVGGMAHSEREAHGFGIWAERTLPRIHGDRIVVDGLRGRAELEVFRKAFGDALIVLAVHASPKTRHERMLRRKRLDDAVTIEAVLARDLRELSWGLGEVIAMADIMLVNESSLDEFRRQARVSLERLHG